MSAPVVADATPSAPAQPSTGGARQWQVGTLTYTAAGLVALFCWLLLGDFAFMMRERSAFPTMQVMLRLYEAGDVLTSVFLGMIPSAMIFVLGPIIGYWSDHTRTRSGRRLPFLLWPTPLIVLSMCGLGFSSTIGRWLHGLVGAPPEAVNLYIISVLGLSWILFEIVIVISNTLFNALINDTVPRQMLGLFFGLFRAVSLGAGILFNYAILPHAATSSLWIFCSIGLLYGVGFTVMCLKVKEGAYPPPPPQAFEGPFFWRLFRPFARYYHECLTKPFYLLVLLFMAIAGFAFIPVNLFSLYAAQKQGLSLGEFGMYVVYTYICSFLLAVPLGWLADRFHPLRVGLVALAMYAVAMTVGYFFIRDPLSFGIVFLLHGVLSGIYFTGSAAIGQMLFPKLRFAHFAAAAGLVGAAITACFSPLIGGLLELLGSNYNATFVMSASIAVLALGLGLVLHQWWQKLGGQRHYVAPE